MVYLDSSVVLAHLLAEDRVPPEPLWQETLAASRLMEYEVRQRFNALGRGAEPSLLDPMFGRVAFVELVDEVIGRARERFPIRVRTLDALHLATADFLREQGASVRIATYDSRLSDAAARMGFESFPLGD